MSVMGKTILFVLLTLLKILGILVLAFILLLLLLLFVAVRYRLCIRLEERRLEGCVTWLGFVVCIPFRVEEGDAAWRLRLLGIPVINSGRQKKPADGRKNKQSKKKKEEHTEKRQLEQQRAEKVESRSENTGLQSAPAHAGEERKPPAGEKRSLFHRISALLLKITGKLREGREQLVTWFKTFADAIRTLKRKVRSVKELIGILRTEHGRAFICIAKENVIHLLGQLRPRVIKGDIIFGLGDPCTTGEALGLLAVLYGWIGTGVKVTPDFMEKRLEGYIKMRGRIRMVTMIRIALRIIWNKEGKKLQKELQKWKEDF